MIWENCVSNSVKEYWKSIAFEPSDGLKAFFIFHSNLSEDTKDYAYTEILKKCVDTRIVKEIEELKEYKEKALDKFTNHSEGFIYHLKMYESKDKSEPFERGYFSNFEQAYHYAKREIKIFEYDGDFMVTRYPINNIDSDDIDDYKEGEEYIRFLFDGIMHSYYVDNCIPDDDDNEKFYNKYYDIPHPFKRGDVLKMMPEYLFHEMPYWHDINDKENLYFIADNCKEPPVKSDFSDIGIGMQAFDANTGEFFDYYHPHNPIKYEYANLEFLENLNCPWYNPLYYPLIEIPSIMKGKENNGSFACIQRALNSLKENHKE